MNGFIGHLFVPGGAHSFAIPVTDEDALKVKELIDILTTKAATLTPVTPTPPPQPKKSKP